METLKRILLIDDEPDILEFLSYNFRKKGFDVTVANNGLDGLVKLNMARPDLIISDILMPEMDGVELCRKVKEHPNLRHIPFIFLTAVSDDYKVLYAMTSGADQFASKPIRFEYLLNIVNSVLQEQQA
jgi:two-component system alkaline phosphatase synthesis response regulator PhoP